MLIKIFQLLTLAALGLYATDSSAQIFKLTFTPSSGSVPPVVTDYINSELQKVEDDINEGLPNTANPDRLMEGMANSSVMSGKGVGSDYASGMRVILLGAGVGVGADLEKNKEADTDLSGVGVQGGLILGTNLGWMDTKKILGLETEKLNVYFNFFGYDMDKKTGDTNASGELKSYGVHFSYDWIKPRGNVLFGWGGVKIHTGYEYNSMKLSFDSKITESINTTSDGDTYSSNINATPEASIDVSTHSIPIEISSSVQFLYFVSLYGGLGADYNLGSATGKGDLNSSPATLSCTAGGGAPNCPAGANSGTITTEANIDGKGNVSPFLYRGFAGVQLNLPFVRIFAQADKAFGNDLVGATVGLRLVY
jgi:hypothetical protein